MFRRRPLLGAAFAAAAFAVALATRFALDHAFPPGFPFVTFFPAVIVTTFLAGTRAGILCSLLSGIAAWYWFLPPVNSFALDRSNAVALGFYLFVVAVDILIIDMMARATSRLSAAQATSERLIEQQRTMFAELQHRVANNLAFVSSLLSLQKRKAVADPALSPKLFDEAVHRLEVMARIHRRLHQPAALDQPLEEYLRQLCSEVVAASSDKAVVCDVRAADVRLDLPKLTALSLIVSEVITNSLKHAFHDRDDGAITLAFEQLGDGRCELRIGDDGPGLPATPPPAGSLGLKIIRGLAAQLGGEVSLGKGRGAETRVRFAA